VKLQNARDEFSLFIHPLYPSRTVPVRLSFSVSSVMLSLTSLLKYGKGETEIGRRGERRGKSTF